MTKALKGIGGLPTLMGFAAKSIAEGLEDDDEETPEPINEDLITRREREKAMRDQNKARGRVVGTPLRPNPNKGAAKVGL